MDRVFVLAYVLDYRYIDERLYASSRLVVKSRCSIPFFSPLDNLLDTGSTLDYQQEMR